MLTNAFKLLAAIALLASAAAFSLERIVGSKECLHRHSSDQLRIFSQLLILKSASSNDVNFSEEELQKMDDLIISLSLEPTDESRRERLQSIFDEELAKPNGAPQHFSDLFSHMLVIVGDRVKLEAQEYAAQLTVKAEKEKAEADAEESDDEGKKEKDGIAFAGQRQLWGLVDMLIQSKTIIKRASGDLGNKGSFQ